MAFSELLRLLVTADIDSAVRGIKKVGDTTTKELGRSQKSLDRWGKGLTTVGAGMVAFGATALVGLGKAAQASEEARLSQLKLENTLANMPMLAGENSKSFIDLAESIQSKTAADADQIIEAEALLGTFRLTGDEIRKITPLVVDYSRKFGVDMTDAAKQVGKALDGQIGALKRSGVSIDEALFKTDRYAAVTKALRDQVGGFAEQEGKTFAGSLERMKNELGDVAEGVGTGAVDAFSTLFGIVDTGTDKLNDLSPATQNAIGKFATFGSVALIAAGGLSFTIGQLIKMRQNFGLAQEAIASFAGSGGLGRLTRISLVIGGFVALREVLMSLDNDLEGIDVSRLENELLDLAEKGKVTGDSLKNVFEGFGDAIKSGDPQKLEAWSNKLNEVDKALAQLASRDPKKAAAAFNEIETALRRQGASADDIKRFFNDYAAAIAQADTAARTGAGGVDELGGAVDDQAEGVDEATEAIENYKDALHGLADPLFAALDASRGVEEAKRKEAEAQVALNEALKGGDPTAIAEATRNLQEAQLAQGDAALDAQEAMAVLKDAMDRQIVTVDGARSMLRQWVADGLITESAAAELAEQFGLTTDAAQVLGAQRPVVYVSAAGIPQTNENFRRVKAAAATIPRLKTITITADGSSAIATAGGVKRYIDGLTGTIRVVAYATPSYQTFGGGQGMTKRQHGGPVSGGRLYEVAENYRAELLQMGGRSYLIPGSNGYVVPASHWGGGMGGQPMSVDITLHVTGNGGVAKLIHEEVRAGRIQLSANGQRVRAG